jgi:hypothetical protein
MGPYPRSPQTPLLFWAAFGRLQHFWSPKNSKTGRPISLLPSLTRMPPRQVTGVKRKEPAPCEDDEEKGNEQRHAADLRLASLGVRPIRALVCSSATTFVDRETRRGAVMFVETGHLPQESARPRRLDILAFVLRQATHAFIDGDVCPSSVWPHVITEFSVLLSLWKQQCWPLSVPDIAGVCTFRRVYKAVRGEWAAFSRPAKYILVCACMELGMDMTGHIQDTTAPLILCGPPWDYGHLERHVRLLRMIDEPTWHADRHVVTTYTSTCRCTLLHAYVDSMIAHEVLLHADVQDYVFPADGSGGWSLDRKCKEHGLTPIQSACAASCRNPLYSLQYNTLRSLVAGRPLRAIQHREDVAAHLLTLPPLCNDVVSVCIAYLTFL